MSQFNAKLGLSVGTGAGIMSIIDAQGNITAPKVGIGSPLMARYALDVRGLDDSGVINTDIGLNLNPVINPNTASVAQVATVTGNPANGTYYHNVTFITAVGETNCQRLGPTTVDASHKQMLITLPISSDYRVTGRKIYRSVVNGSYWTTYLLTTISDNTTLTYQDNLADGSLGAYGGFWQINSTCKMISVNNARALVLDQNGTHLGYLAGANLTSGGGNTFIGVQAGYYTQDGSSNVCIGFQSGLAIVSGTANVTIGYQCVNNISNPISGSHNICMGWDVGGTLTTSATSNIAIGSYTLNNGAATPMVGTVAIGMYAGGNYIGYGGTFLGYYAGNYETSQDHALIIDSIDRSNQANSRNYALIYGVGNATPASQTLQLGGGGKVGIGTIAPGYNLDVQGSTSTGGINTDIGLNLNPVNQPVSGSTALVTTGTGNLSNGVYSYCITFITALGETNAYQLNSSTVDASHKQVTVNIPVSTDYRVTGRKIYRTTVGGNYYTPFLLTTVADNSTLSYVDNIADGSLGAAGGYFQPNTTCQYITVQGSKAMTIDPNGSTHFGIQAGNSVTIGAQNTLIGYWAGHAVTSGLTNTIMGFQSGVAITNGSDNTLIGVYSGGNISTGAGNVGLGRAALYNFSTSGSYNTGIGTYALGNTSGSTGGSNTALGYGAGNVATGSDSIFLGAYAGYYETSTGSLLIVDSKVRGSQANQAAQALIYGVMNTTAASQTLQLGGTGIVTINGTQASTSNSTGCLKLLGGLGVAGAINYVTITAPGSAATLTLVGGSTLATNAAYTYTLTSAGNSTVTFPNSTSATMLYYTSAPAAQYNLPYANATSGLIAYLGNTNYGALVSSAAGVPQWATPVANSVLYQASATTVAAMSSTPTLGSLTLNANALTTFASSSPNPSLIVSLGSASYTGTSIGAVWNDNAKQALGTFLGPSGGGIKSYIPGVLATIKTTNTVTLTTATTYYSVLVTGNMDPGAITLPANWWTVGKTVRIILYAQMTTTGAGALSIRPVLQGTTVVTAATVALTTTTSYTIRIEVLLTCQATGSAGTAKWNCSVNSNVFLTTAGAVPGQAMITGQLAATRSTTETQTLDLQVTMSAGASNPFIVWTGTIEHLN